VKHGRRRVTYWTLDQAHGWGPYIVAQLARGELVDVAGFLLKLAPQQQELKLRPTR
jgi:hypothetical protein